MDAGFLCVFRFKKNIKLLRTLFCSIVASGKNVYNHIPGTVMSEGNKLELM